MGSRDFKPFVADQVGAIQTSTNPEQWIYIPTSLNPADILSRGMRAADLEHCNKWWSRVLEKAGRCLASKSYQG